MPALVSPALAEAVLALHVAVIAFNIFGLVAPPLGALFDWRFVRVVWWRWLHLVSMALVAVQASAGRACFLTLIEDALVGRVTRTPLIMGFFDRVIYWPLPPWVFEAGYQALFVYALALMRLVPPGRRE